MVIYGLIDPRTNQVRYIGRTGQRPAYRLTQHIKRASDGAGGHLCNWLRQLTAAGLRPDLVILEDDIPHDQSADRERFWIAEGKSREWRLTNMSSGGDGLLDPSPEIREARRQRMLGNTYANGNRNAVGQRSPEFCARMAEVAKHTKNHTGYPHSEETRAVIAERLRAFYANGGPTPSGERNGHCVLSDEQVNQIRERYKPHVVSALSLAQEFGVTRSYIYALAYGRARKYVKEGE